MKKEQIGKVVKKQLPKRVAFLVIFHLVGSISLRYLDSTDELSTGTILTFIVMNILLLFALTVDLLIAVLEDLHDIERNTKDEKNIE